MVRHRILIAALAATFAAHASAQGPNATRREAGIAGGALMSILGVQADDSPLQVQPRRAHKTGGEIMLPFQVRNVSSSAVKGFRLVAFIVSEDGTVRFRQPFESSREIGAGKAWSGEMTLRQPLITSSHSAIFVIEHATTETGAFELTRAEAEQAALEMFLMSTGRK